MHNSPPASVEPNDYDLDLEVVEYEQQDRKHAKLFGNAAETDVREFCDALWEVIMERNKDAYDKDWLDLPEEEAKEINTPRETLREYIFDSTMTLFCV